MNIKNDNQNWNEILEELATYYENFDTCFYLRKAVIILQYMYYQSEGNQIT
jgi:hypothetical protein